MINNDKWLDSIPKTDLKNLVCLIDWNKGQNDGWSKDSHQCMII